MKVEYKAYCNLCAFNCNHEDGCIALNKRRIPCWAKCIDIEELDRRYKSILQYCIGDEIRKKIKKEYNLCLSRLEERR